MARRKTDPTSRAPSATEAGDQTPAPDDSPAPPAAPPITDPPAEPGPVAEPEPVAAPPEPADEPVVPEPAPHSEPEAVGSTADRYEAAVEEEEEGGRSFAAWALIVLLLLLGGAALGIWAAPRIAPMLPSGMAPVAAWLNPGADDAEARIAALEERLDSALAATQAQVAALPDADALDARIAAAVAEAQSATAGDVAALREAVGELDTSAIRQQLDALSATLDGQAAELDTLKDQIAGGVAASGDQADEVVARIDVYRAELEGLRAEVAGIGNRTSALASRIDEVAATADRSIEAAQARVAEVQAESSTALDAAQVASDMALLRAALAAGEPFAEVAQRLDADPATALPEGLAAAAASGAPTLASLRARFPEAAHEAIRASIIAGAGEGILARTGAFLNAQVASRSLTPQPGMSPDAVLSRMEDALRNGDLAAALAEAENLPSEASAAMSGWLADARLRLAADAGLSELSTRLPVAN